MKGYYERQFPNAATDCFYWYWGNTEVAPNTCIAKGHNNQQCQGKCRDYINTHTQVMEDLKQRVNKI